MPIVAVTANAMREDFERCREAGMDDFVAKPVTLAALANAIERAVAASRGEGASPEVMRRQRRAIPALSTVRRSRRCRRTSADPTRCCGSCGCFSSSSTRRPTRSGGGQGRRARDARTQRPPDAFQCRNAGATALADTLAALEIAAHEGDAAACDQLAATFAADVLSTRTTFEAVLEELDLATSTDG